jgi:hypothetical protein
MRRIGIAILTAAMLSVAAIGSASAHVHGITPLRCVGVENDGANGAQGGPITGLIPLAVGNAEASDGVVAFGKLGFDTPACPVED